MYLFDCFGVVVSDVSVLWAKDRFDGSELDYMRNFIYYEVDRGRISQQQVFEQLAARYGMSVQDVKDQWDKCLFVKWDTVELIQKIRRSGGTVALLSNAAVEYIDYIFDKYDLNKYFDKIFVSARYGVAKPEQQFYKLCLDSFHQHFDNVYFTDDNPANLVDLQQLGITAIQFTSASELENKLKL